MSTITRVIRNEKGVFTENAARPHGWREDIWKGVLPIRTEESKDIAHRWIGRKIRLSAFEQIKAFFEWSYSTTHAETMIHGFYHEDHGWEFLALPQRGWSGMTVSLIADHANYQPTMDRLPITGGDESVSGWMMMASFHHHCGGSAFQSSVDHSDEKTKEGLHITLGGIGSEKYSIHSRTSFGRVIADCHLADWFDLGLDNEILSELPVESLDKVLERRLCAKATNVEFPEWWKDNVIKTTYQTGTSGSGYSGGNYSGTSSASRYNNGTPGYSGSENSYNHRSVPDDGRQTKRYNRNKQDLERRRKTGLAEFEKRWISREINEYCEKNKVSLNDLMLCMEDYQRDILFSDIVDLVCCIMGYTLEEAIKIIGDDLDAKEMKPFLDGTAIEIDENGKEVGEVQTPESSAAQFGAGVGG